MTRWKTPKEKVRPGSAAISFDAEVLDEIRAEAERQGRSLSWMLQRAWKAARRRR